MTTFRFILLPVAAVVVAAWSTGDNASAAAADKKEKPDYATHVAPLFRKYCVGCHNAKDAEGKLNLQSFAGVMQGGENGKIVVAKDAAKSRLLGVLEGRLEPAMPPEGSKRPSKTELARLKAWIEAGASGPKGVSPNETLIVPKIAPAGKVRRAINAIAAPPTGKERNGWIAVARHGVVEILDAKSQKPLRTLDGLTGDVSDLSTSADGKLLAAASGEPGLRGKAVVWNTGDWKPVAELKGHADSLYAVALSPDGKLLATGSYDQKIKLWDVAKRKELRQLEGHNGPIHDLAFHPGGKILASASGDRTVKIWDVATGKRLDTLGQPEKDQYAVAFSPDGKRIVAGGGDNRIRVWAVQMDGSKPASFPLLHARFSHEAAILRLACSPDGKRLVSSSEDRTVKLWETAEFTQLRSFKNQSDWATGLAVAADNETVYIGRMNGSLSRETIRSDASTRVAKVEPIELPPTPVPPKQTAERQTIREVEPNDSPTAAQRIASHAAVEGVLTANEPASQDVDVYRFRADAGQTIIIETRAAQKKSPADTKIEVLHPDGKPVLRHLLRAVRDSYITFRPIDSRQNQVRVKNWEEMGLNQYLYMGGEVCRLFRMPQGPDSGFLFYTIGGKRRCYFDTSATVHAKEDPVYIVEAYPPGTELVDNGLPVFPLYYQNDDDGERKLGNDSRLTFTAPHDGEFLVRVSDARGMNGKDFKYELTLRPPKPDFNVSLAGGNATVPQGSGRRLKVNVDRIDGFTGEVQVEFSGLPDGFSVTSPIIVEQDHLSAEGVINVDARMTPTVQPQPKGKAGEKQRRSRPAMARKPVDWSRVKVTATALVHGRKVEKPVSGFGPIQVGPKPNVLVRLEVDPEQSRPAASPGELVIAPGETITAMLRIERNGFQGELKFDVDHLPHGVIVDNIGLSGILVRANENERRIELTAADWVRETTRQISAVAQTQGNQASRPIVLHVRRDDASRAAK